MKNAAFIFIFVLSYSFTIMIGHSQVIKDPISVMMKGNPGDTKFREWILDLNQDGIPDLLITVTLNDKEIAEAKDLNGELYDPNETYFVVFIGQKDGYTLLKEREVQDPYALGQDGTTPGGISIMFNNFYAGQVEEVKQYGIVTLETCEVTAASGHGHPEVNHRVVCYYMKGGRLIERYLTGCLDLYEQDTVYKKYLSDENQTNITLKTIDRK